MAASDANDAAAVACAQTAAAASAAPAKAPVAASDDARWPPMLPTRANPASAPMASAMAIAAARPRHA